ncbi:hypothetical protein JW964_16845 [candidate division KSB1 bacterium]|nr:hypothetical protein [candidate division KSB1 bacterium]
MLFAPRRQPRKFQFKSRYSNPGEQDKPYHIDFQRKYPGSSKNRRTVLYFICVCLIVVYLLIFFRKFTVQQPDVQFEVEDIKVQ